MALSAAAKKRLEVAMARRAQALEVSTAIDANTTAVAALSASTAGGTLTSGHLLIGSAGNVATDVALSGDATLVAAGTLTIGAGAITTTKLGAAAVTAAKLAFFKSTEQTGTGSSQDIAHGLVTTPGLVIVQVTDALAGDSTFVEGSHDATNVKVTATSGAKYKVIAIK